MPRRKQAALKDVDNAFFLHTLNPLCVAGLDGYFKRVNPAFQKTIGYSEKEILSKPILDFVHPEDREKTRQEMSNLGEGKSTIRFENRYICKKGKIHWLAWTCPPPDPESGLLYASAQDITSQKVAERKLAESNARFQSLVANLPGVVYRCANDADWTMEFISDTIEEFSGYPAAEFVESKSRSYASVIHPQDREMVSRTVQNALRQKKPFTIEYRIVHKDKRVLWVFERGQGAFSNRGELLWLDGAIFDATKSKEAEELIRSSKDYLDKIINAIADPLFVKDREHRWVLLNDAYCEFMGYLREDLLGKSDYDFFPKKEADIFWERDEVVFHEGKGDINEEQFTNAAGITHTIVTKKSLHKDPVNGSMIVGTIRDVTEERRLQEQLGQAQKMEAIGKLAGGIAHDFNNTMMIVKGYCEFLSEELRSQPSVYQQIKEIEAASERATALTKQLLAFSRRQIVTLRDINLSELIESSKKMLRLILKEQINLRFLKAKTSGRVHIDLGQIQQVLVNLAINARDAMPHGGTFTVKVREIQVTTEDARHFPRIIPGEYAMIQLTDTGAGMDENIKRQAFEPFFTTKSEEKGTGLGLATSYGLIRQNNGFIYLDSKEGSGTMVTIFLPIVGKKKEGRGAKRKKKDLPVGDETILFVDDEKAILDLGHQTLSAAGYRVLCALNGVEAKKYLKRKYLKDLTMVVTDISMPGMGGVELAKYVQKKAPHVKILFITGFANEKSKEMIADIQEQWALIEKPYTRESFLRKVRDVLDQ